MDRIDIRESTWRGVSAWLFAGPKVEVVVTRVGGHIAAVRAPGDSLNPLWQPPWPAGTPALGASREDLYGPPAEGELLATIVGHNLCLDRFGPPWPGEGRPVHGEAGAAEWCITGAAADRAAVLTCSLPEAGLRLERSLGFNGESVTVTTRVAHVEENGVPRDSTPIEWAEHVTVGDPFLDGAAITAGVDGAWISGLAPEGDRRFAGTSESPVEPAEVLAMPPASQSTACGDVISCRVTDGWFRVERPDLGRRLEYCWQEDEFPWLCIWTEHHSRTGAPWNGETRARGLEFSTKPFPEGKPPLSREHHYQGRPTTCSVGSDRVLERSFTLRWSRV